MNCARPNSAPASASVVPMTATGPASRCRCRESGNLADDTMRSLTLHDGPRLYIATCCVVLNPGALLLCAGNDPWDFSEPGVPSVVVSLVGDAEHQPAQMLDYLPWSHAGTNVTPRKRSQSAGITVAGHKLAHKLSMAFALSVA